MKIADCRLTGRAGRQLKMLSNFVADTGSLIIIQREQQTFGYEVMQSERA